MIYSCFNEKRGDYAYYQDDLQIPANGDLPVPANKKIAGTVGVPTREMGRPLPISAVYIGNGWHAKGMIVNCGDNGVGLGSFGETVTNILVPAISIGIIVLLVAARYVGDR